MSGEGEEIPQQVHAVQKEIEMYSVRLDEMMQSVKAMETQGEGGWLEQLLGLKKDMEKSLKTITKKLVKLSRDHRDDLAISKHITGLYKKLGDLISGTMAELALAVQQGSDSVGGEIQIVMDWSNSQLATLKKTYTTIYENLSSEVQTKLETFHDTYVPYLDYVSEKFMYYTNPANAASAKERIEEDFRAIARRAAYHNYPVLGYTADGAWNILSDSSKPVWSRIKSAICFFLITLYLFVKAFLRVWLGGVTLSVSNSVFDS